MSDWFRKFIVTSLQSILDGALCWRVKPEMRLFSYRIYTLFYMIYRSFLSSGQHFHGLSIIWTKDMVLTFLSAFSWVVNHTNQGYGVNIPLNAKEKSEYTFKMLKEWPNVVKELHLKNIYDPKKGYNLQDKLSSNQNCIQLKVYEDIHKAAQESLENILE